MAFKLTKDESRRRDEFVQTLNELSSKLEDAIAEYNARMEELQAPVQRALGDYNETLGEARGFVEDIASDRSSEFDEKSERWQESDRASAVRDWISEWEGASFDDVELTFPEELDFPAPSYADDLESLPSNAE